MSLLCRVRIACQSSDPPAIPATETDRFSAGQRKRLPLVGGAQPIRSMGRFWDVAATRAERGPVAPSGPYPPHMSVECQ